MRDYEPYYTEDGSIGLYSYGDKDVFHSKFGALTEAWEKFVIPSKIDELLTWQEEINVLDICYGIGYNTKALMTFVIENNKNKIYKKNIFQKIFNFLMSIVSIDSDNIQKKKKKKISIYNEAIHNNKFSDKDFLPKIYIDCLDINEELIKLSPLFKTVKTPAEYFSYILPDIFDCFKFYYKLQNVFVNIFGVFSPKNKKNITELLELKFKNMHIDKEYKVNPIVNYILINRVSEIYGKEYLTKDIKNILREKWTRRFFAKSLIKYAKFNQFWGYRKTSGGIISTFLHNIYYLYLSKRYKNIKFKAAESLFEIKFHLNDARKSIQKIDKQYDCIFLDAFTYTKAPQLWSVEFIAELYKRLKDNGVLMTYSNSAQIRNTFLENNFYVGKIFNEKYQKFVGTIASKDKSKIEYPLNNYEIGLCNTKAGIPYHDPNLAFSAKDIMELREYEFRHSELMSSSKYMKYRSIRSDDNEV
ncbi:hypothetical protein IKQ21_04330 [bacterium]|nr:hypothetical protein [bacterium]